MERRDIGSHEAVSERYTTIRISREPAKSKNRKNRKVSMGNTGDITAVSHCTLYLVRLLYPLSLCTYTVQVLPV